MTEEDRDKWKSTSMMSAPQIQALRWTVVRVIKCLYGCMYVTLGWKTAKEQNGTATATTERIHNYRLPQ